MNAPLANHAPGFKFLAFLGITLVSLFVFSFIAVALMYVFFDINLMSNPNVFSQVEDPEVVKALKFMQLVNAISLFFIPPVIFAFLVTNNKISYFKLHLRGNIIFYLVVPVLMLASIPLINVLAELNNAMNLPDFLGDVEEWMKASEESAKRITEAFLHVNTIEGLLFNILLIAIIPAIGEELLFRGVLQRLFSEATKNKHLGVWISAILFSAIHMQFYGFIPRMMMGVLFGYLLVWSGSLWIPILAHFANNATAVIMSYLVQNKTIPGEMETVGSAPGDYFYVITSTMVVALLVYFYYANRVQEPDELQTE